MLENSNAIRDGNASTKLKNSIVIEKDKNEGKCNSQRCDKALGRAKMPEGYELWRDGDGCYWWSHPASYRSSSLHWDRWAIYRSAKIDYQQMIKFHIT
ncbi:MAG: hypothetical protein AAFR90_05000 [Pseudomonadota bacterium]